MSENALYYPYIHVRDVDWLKATLLLFKRVHRIVPYDQVEGDKPEIAPFARPHGGRRALLHKANLDSDRVQEAQRRLADQLRRSAQSPAFVRRYGVEGARPGLRKDPLGFQIHQQKLLHDLTDALGETGLAWAPWASEPWDYRLEYIQVHPKVGEAVMSTLAIACATANDFDVVSDDRARQLHRVLLERDETAVFDSYLGRRPPKESAEPKDATGAEVFQFFVNFACDTRGLDAQRLAQMGEDREPIRRLMSELNRRAAFVGRMDPGPERLGRLEQTALEILQAWEADRRNMSRFWREFFGFGLAESGSKTAEKLAEAAIVANATGAGLHGGGVLGAVAGLGIGLAVRGGRIYKDHGARERNSPFSYLSSLQKAGVTFQFDKLRVPTGLRD